jgi:uncharacterized protein YcbK (DUF882 family)
VQVPCSAGVLRKWLFPAIGRVPHAGRHVELPETRHATANTSVCRTTNYLWQRAAGLVKLNFASLRQRFRARINSVVFETASGFQKMNVVSRRGFLTALAAGLPALALTDVASAAELLTRPSVSAATRALSFAHTHTGEHLNVEYFTGGRYLPDALSTVNHFLRDFRTGDVHDIDSGLLDLLYNLHGLTGSSRPFQVISGYRSPKTNAMLRARSEGVAAGSLHMQGQAIDIRLADVQLPKLRDAALAARRGGVGFYPASDFVHVDTGRVRRW